MNPIYTACFYCTIMMFAELSMAHRNRPRIYQEHLNYTTTTTTVSEITEETTANVSSESSSSDSYGNYSMDFIKCQKLPLSPGEYSILKNASIHIPQFHSLKMKSLIKPGNYYIQYLNETFAIAYICAHNSIVSPKAERERQHKGPLTYITYACLCISLLSLALHFAAFLVVPEMRNLPGKNLASLTFSLFLAYLLFLVGTEFDKTAVCHPLGVCIYYFMMVSFFWMNVISYDVFRSVRDATAKLRTSANSAESKRFFLYSLYSWMVPILFLTVVIAAEETTIFPRDLNPLFNRNRCWFQQRLAVIAFFATPAGILMLANVFFFVASAILISSNSMKSDKHKSNLKRNVLLYLKLIVICGLLWITGLVEDFVNKEAFSYAILALYSLQGLYIFIAFTRFKQIIDRFSRTKAGISSNGPSVFNSTFSSRNTSRRAITKEMKGERN